jgi:hypothetical protein
VQITNSTGIDLYVAALQLTVADGESIDVDDVLGEQLVVQGWRPKTAKRPTTKADEAVEQEK